VSSGDQTIWPRWLAPLICTDCTPGTARKASSKVMAQAAQCMPSNTTLERQQPDSVFSGKLNAAHSSGASSSSSRCCGVSRWACASSGATDSNACGEAGNWPGKTLTWVMFRRYDSRPDQTLMYIKRCHLPRF